MVVVDVVSLFTSSPVRSSSSNEISRSTGHPTRNAKAEIGFRRVGSLLRKGLVFLERVGEKKKD